MKATLCALLALAAAGLPVRGEPPAAPALAPTANPTNDAEAVVARVGTSEIRRRELTIAMRGLLMQLAQQQRGVPPDKMPQFEHDVLDEMIGRELMLQEIRNKPSASADEVVQKQLAQVKTAAGGEEAFAKALKETSVSLEEYTRRLRDNVLLQEARQCLLDEKVKISPDEVKNFYDDNSARFKRPEMVRASHILIQVPRGAGDETRQAKRTQIEAARALVKGGEKFAAVAGKVSEDPVSARNGGDLGFFARGQMVPEFELAAFSLQTNQLSEVITTSYGYHVLMVTDRRAAQTETFDNVKGDIEKFLKGRRGTELARDHVKELRAKAKVEILLPPLPAEPAPKETPPAPVPAANNPSTAPATSSP